MSNKVHVLRAPHTHLQFTAMYNTCLLSACQSNIPHTHMHPHAHAHTHAHAHARAHAHTLTLTLTWPLRTAARNWPRCSASGNIEEMEEKEPADITPHTYADSYPVIAGTFVHSCRQIQNSLRSMFLLLRKKLRRRNPESDKKQRSQLEQCW